MFERFTERSKRVLVLARQEAGLLSHAYLGTEHILLGLIREGEGVAARVLEAAGMDLEAARGQVVEIVGLGQEPTPSHIPLDSLAKRILELSLQEMAQLGHDQVGTEHLLLGLTATGQSIALQVFVRLGTDPGRVRQLVLSAVARPTAVFVPGDSVYTPPQLPGTGGVAEFQLEASEFENLARWRWILTSSDGKVLADHRVRLDTSSWQYKALNDLGQHLRLYAAPDQRIADEARIVAEVGVWMGAEVLGPIAAALAGAGPAIVRVVVPAEPKAARGLLHYPLELAYAGDGPLALQGVTLVMQLAGEDALPATPTSSGGPPGRVRVLGLFSLPSGTRALNLRGERQALVERLAAAADGAVEVRVLQYGVTKARLRDVLADGGGWDVIHISGHGRPGELLLEREDGSPEKVSAAELARLLELSRQRVKLVAVSACSSAALEAESKRRLLGLAEDAAAGGAEESQPQDDTGGPAAGALATELAARLDCAVLAMRYPVSDEFSAALISRLYDLLIREGRVLPQALAISLVQAIAVPPTAACPALSVATPALFGAHAGDLMLPVSWQPLPAAGDGAATPMAGFPPQPVQFVGRTEVMARASGALARASQTPGVLLFGMPGGGKTSCALELAYTHEHAFDHLMWFKAPDEGQNYVGTLTEFALTLERNLRGVRFAHLLDLPESLAAFLPQLTERMERQRVLIVIDGVESLLTEEGLWRDERWAQLTTALCAHSGLGRVVLASRRVPCGPSGTGAPPGLAVVAVDALSLDEALLLAEQLPHLRTLMHGELREIPDKEMPRLARGVLNIAQGHPKLLELADGQAADPARLSALLRVGDQAWRLVGGLPAGFFTAGSSTQIPGENYMHVLDAWTRTVWAGLSTAEQALFGFLCCLEEKDRTPEVVGETWPGIWRRLPLPASPPALDPLLRSLAECGLAALHPGGYDVHPGVAAAGRRQAGTALRNAVDVELAGYWGIRAMGGYGQETQLRITASRDDELGGSVTVVSAGLAGAAYFLRQEQWEPAAEMLQEALLRDPSRETAASALPAIQRIATARPGPANTGLLALALEALNPAKAEQRMRESLATAVAAGQWIQASSAASTLIHYCCKNGKLTEALAIANEAAAYTQQASLGQWSRLADEVRPLRVMSLMGKADYVLSEARRLSEYAATLPESSDRPENTEPWSVREMLLDLQGSSAVQLERWKVALEVNSMLLASMRGRGALPIAVARVALNDCAPLVALGRFDDAFACVSECRRAFEEAHDNEAITISLGYLASLEDKRGHGDAAIRLQRDHLRYCYLTGNVTEIAVGYELLGNLLARHFRQLGQALPCHLAGAMIRTLAGLDGVDNSVADAAADLDELGEDVAVPEGTAGLCHEAPDDTGDRLMGLLQALAPEPDRMEEAFDDLLARVRDEAAPGAAYPHWLATWDPVLSAMVAARMGNQQAAAEFDQAIDRHLNHQDWGALAAVLRRVREGDRTLDLRGLDDIDAAIAARAIAARDGKVTIPASLWHAIAAGMWLGRMVSAALGDPDDLAWARQALRDMKASPKGGPLSEVLGEIIDGNRNRGIVRRLDDVAQRDIGTSVLQHVSSWRG